MGFHMPQATEQLPSLEDINTIAKIVFGKARFGKGVSYISNISSSPYKDKVIRATINNSQSVIGLDLYLFFTRSNTELSAEGLTILSQCITLEIPYLKVRKHHTNTYFEIFDWQLIDTKRRLRENLKKQGR